MQIGVDPLTGATPSLLFKEEEAMRNRREIALLVKTKAGWLQVDVTTKASDIDAMVHSNLKNYPIDTPYKIQQRVVLYEKGQEHELSSTVHEG